MAKRGRTGSVNLACDEIMFDGSTKTDQHLKPASLSPPPSSSSASSSSSAASAVTAFNDADTRDPPSRQTHSSIRFDKEDSPFTGEACSSGRGTRRRSLGYYHGLCCGGRCPASAVAESTIAVHDPDPEDGDKGRSKGSTCGSGCRAVEEALDRIWRHNHPCLVVGLTAGFVVLVIMVLGVTIHSAERIESNQRLDDTDVNKDRHIMVVGGGTVLNGALPAVDLTTNELPMLQRFLTKSLQFQIDRLIRATELAEFLESVLVTGVSPTDRHTWFSFQLSFSNGNRHRRILREKTVVDELISGIKRAIGSKGELGMFVLDFNSLSVYRPSSESMASSYEPIHAEVKLNTDSIDVSPPEDTLLPVCKSYNNVTCFPNILNHSTQLEAATAGLNNLVLLEFHCSKFLQFFWCSIFVPDCSTGVPLPPCRSLCSAVLEDCPYLAESFFNLTGGCDALPDTSNGLCSDVPSTLDDPDSPLHIDPWNDFSESLDPVSDECIPVRTEQCLQLGYNSTSPVNMLGQDASGFAPGFWWNRLQLVQTLTGCSTRLLPFACHVLFPPCSNQTDRSGSMVPLLCRELCQVVKEDCWFFLELADLHLLSEFDCMQLPTSSNISSQDAAEEICMNGDAFNKDMACEEDEFSCDGRQCVNVDWICDGQVDCMNGADEIDCAVCSESSQYRCHNGRCIDSSRVCDGFDDCRDGDDEMQCIKIESILDSQDIVQVFNATGSQWTHVCLTVWNSSIAQDICYNQRPSRDEYGGRRSHLLRHLQESTCNDENSKSTFSCNYSACVHSSKAPSSSPSRSIRLPEGTDEVLLGVGDWPWQASIHFGARQIYFCGGVFIGDRWLLTAAHCVSSSSGASEWTVSGGHSRRSSASETRQNRKVVQVFVHPSYSVEQMNDDIALLQLDAPVSFDSSLRPLCLPDVNQSPPVNATCYLGGWGKHSDEDTHFRQLPYLRLLTVQPESRCLLHYYLKSDQEGRLLCTTGRKSCDSCQGDSGSAVLCRSSAADPSSNLFFAGIVSRGEQQCGNPNLPSIQTRVSTYVDWIQKITSGGT